MPRKYHRPPTTTAKRRKGKKAPAPQLFEESPEPQNGDAVFAPEESLPIVESSAAPAPPVARLKAEAIPKAEATGKATTVKHMTRDHSYVSAEVLRIVAVGGFLIISLIITSILRG